MRRSRFFHLVILTLLFLGGCGSPGSSVNDAVITEGPPKKTATDIVSDPTRPSGATTDNSEAPEAPPPPAVSGQVTSSAILAFAAPPPESRPTKGNDTPCTPGMPKEGVSRLPENCPVEGTQ